MATSASNIEDFAKGELLKMVTEGWVPRVIEGITQTISKSFKSDQVLRPVITKNEIKRRFKICLRGFFIMRRDLQFAVPHILDELPNYLRCELDGMDWSPPIADKSWIAGDKATGIVDGPDLVGETPYLDGTEIGPD